MLFLVILPYKTRGRPTQARAWPEPDPKTEARHVPWDSHGQDFLDPKKTRIFPARPGPTRGMLRSNWTQSTVWGSYQDFRYTWRG
jgi:hypothetical protein